MRISFRPQRFAPSEATELTISKEGDVLTINGDVLDLSVVPEGAILPGEAIDSRFIATGPITRVDGQVHVTLVIPCRAGDIEVPAPLIDPADGPLAIPDLLTEEEGNG